MDSLEFIRNIVIYALLLTWALRHGKKIIVNAITELGNFISEIKKAVRKTINKIKNS